MKTQAASTTAPAVEPQAAADLARACFLRACWLDVAVRKPGNVSLASPGHGMQAGQFIDSALAAAGPLCQPGERVGRRIEQAMAASWAAAGCNTDLGILLLCAPIVAAAERPGALAGPAALAVAIENVLAGLNLEDARCAFRAIALANPGGLGSAAEQDVRAAPSVDLRSAMRLAAGHDSIARFYAEGYAELFERAEPLLDAGFPGYPGFQGGSVGDGAPFGLPGKADAARVQRVFIDFLASRPDSHIVRKHGEAAAHIVMVTAQAWRAHGALEADPGFIEWDESLKARRINPGTSADLTVAALLLAGLLGKPQPQWHGP